MLALRDTPVKAIKTLLSDMSTGQLKVDSPSLSIFPGDSRLCQVVKWTSRGVETGARI